MKPSRNQLREGRRRRGIAVAVVAVALAVGAGRPAAAQILELQPRVVVTGARILLQDLVRPGLALPEGWGGRSIGEAPAPTETRSLPLTEVAQAMSEYDDMNRVVLRGHPVIQVNAKLRSVDMMRVQQAVDEYARANEPWVGRRFEVTVDRLNLPHVPEGSIDLEVAELREDRKTGELTARVQVIVDGQPYGDGPLEMELLELQPFWAAARPLTRGETLTAEALEKRWMTEREAGRYYPAEHSLEGMELRRTVQAGQLLAAGMLAEPVFAKRGEVVRVVSRRGALTVTLRARALSDGRRDERILCVNEQSGRRMHVRLVQPRGALLEDEPGETPS